MGKVQEVNKTGVKQDEVKVVTTGTPATTSAVAPAAPKTEAELMAEMNSAVKSGDYKLVAKVAADLVKFQKDKEQHELEAKQKVLAELTGKVKKVIDDAVEELIKAGTLDQADGIWYSYDFGDKSTGCRLMKIAAKIAGTRTTTSGGAGKKFSIGTAELMEKFGNEVYKDGQTFKAAWDSNADKNWRYAIRESLLKKNGNIS